MSMKFFVSFCLFTVALLPVFSADRSDVAQPMAIGLAGVSSYSDNWQFTDMMKHSREWRSKKDAKNWEIVEDKNGWPISLKSKSGDTDEIDKDHQVFMWLYNRKIAGDIVVTWEGDGDVSIQRRNAKLVTDEYPGKNRRVYHWDDKIGGVFDLVINRSNPKDHVRNIHVWMPGFENSKETFHPVWKEIIKPFPYFRFMDWGRTNNSTWKEWSDRKLPENMRQTGGVAYEYMIQLCNEMDKDAWICIPHQASDDFVRQLAKLLKAKLKPERKVYIEYSNEIWNPAFKQTRWLWDIGKKEIKEKDLKDDKGRSRKPWEYGAYLCGRRSAQIWKIVSDEMGDPNRIVRTITHFRWLDKCMEAALDRQYGDGRVDLIALNGYFISQKSLQYALRDLDNWNLDEAMELLEQLHLLEKAEEWEKTIGSTKKQWPNIPVSCYEGGQHFANPFSKGLQGKKLTEKMFEVNADKRIKNIYRTALETWHLAGGDGFTAFVECGGWGKYGCWGHKRYPEQPLEDKVGPDGKVTEVGAHKYVALLDYLERRQGQETTEAPQITTTALPAPVVGKTFQAKLQATKGTPPYKWSVLGGRLPKGLALSVNGKISGTPAKAEQFAFIVDCTDSQNQHASRIMGLFIDPAAGKQMQTVDFSQGLPEGWKLLDQKGKSSTQAVDGFTVIKGRAIPYLPTSSSTTGKDASYTAEVTLAPNGNLNKYQSLGLAFCLSPDGDPEDYLRIYIDGLGHNLRVCSRYVKNSKQELWHGVTCNVIPDEGETDKDTAFDEGEAWTIRATIRPGSSPGAIDLLVSVFDQDGKPRLSTAGNHNVANGILLLRELAIKDALRQGPFGLMANRAKIKQVKWCRTGE